MLSFLVWYLLGIILSSYLSAFGTGTFGLLAQMLLNLVLTVYVGASETAFFLETAPGKIPKRENRPGPGEEGADPGPDPLN